MKQFGIEKIRVYPTALQLDFEELANVRGYDVNHMHKELMVYQRGVNPPWEDPVTMAVNSAKPMLTKEDIDSIGLLIVATETGLDQEKSISSWVFHYLGLPDTCRHFEVKIACYAGTAAVKMALAWLSSGMARKGQKALVVTTDESLNSILKPWEYVCGGGSISLLLSDNPEFLSFELEKSGIYSHEISDVIRPMPWLETGNSEHSLFSYMEALAAAYDNFVLNVGDVDFRTYFKYNIYHVPFSGISFRAHKLLMRMTDECTDAEIAENYKQRVLPSITYAQKIGATYGGSIFLALLGLIDSTAVEPNNRIGVFSYGSGSCAEFYTVLTTEKSKEVARNAGLPSLINSRYPITVKQYEAMELAREERIKNGDFIPDFDEYPDLYAKAYQGKGLLIYKGSKGFYRTYDFS